MTYFILKAHTSQVELHGHTYEFARPLFMTRMHPLQEKGLYVSITDIDTPRLRAYLYLSTEAVLNLMSGWGDQKQPRDHIIETARPDRILEFAEQNIAQFERLVLNVFAEPEAHLAYDGKPWVREVGDVTIHTYTLAPVTEA